MKYKNCKLADIAEIFSGFAFRSKDLGDSGIPIIKIANIQNKRVLHKCNHHLSEKLLSKNLERYYLQDGDTLVAMTGAGSVGKFGKMFGNKTNKYLVNQRVGIIRPNLNLYDPNFLFYVLSNNNYEKILYGLGLGAGQPNVSSKEIGSLEVPYPPLITQRKIASILSAYDNLIENNQRRIKILEEMAQNLYREWFVKFRFPGHENVRFGDSALGRIPEGWEAVIVEQLVQRVPSGKKYNQKTVREIGTIPVLDQGRSGIIGYHNDEPGVMASDDEPIIVFANHTCYQRIVMFPFSAIQNVLPFIPSTEYPRNIYWLHYATKDLVKFNDYKGHWPEFLSKSLLLPPPEICQNFGMFVEPITRLIFKLEKRNTTFRRTRDLLLPKLISGELDVSDLDITIPEENNV